MASRGNPGLETFGKESIVNRPTVTEKPLPNGSHQPIAKSQVKDWALALKV